ncbi:MAG TPA: helix-turn-helix domain-containing protein [Thermoleophilaceae bacterium]
MPIARSKARRTQQERSEATTAELLAAARELFAADGYAATSLDAIAAAAGVTKGALYHHFDSKRDVFRAVYEGEQRRLAQIESDAYRVEDDPWEGFYAGCRAFLEASLDPRVQQITLLDAPGALGLDTMMEIEADALAMTKDGLRHAMEADCIPTRPVDPLAHLLFGALCEAAMKIARSRDQEAELRGMLAELRRMLDALAAEPAPD